MSESICVTLEKFAKEKEWFSVNRTKHPDEERSINLELKLSFDGEQYFIEEAWLDDTIDFYAIADKYNFLDKLLEEALAQKLLDEKNTKLERGYIENFD